MKQRLFSPLFALLALTSLSFAGEGWITDYQDALKQAKEQNRPVLVDFTGSDWCGWCIKLNKEVFSKPEFQDFAKDNLVLLEIDFPSNPKSLPAATQKQNAELQKKFGVDGFPTLVLLDGDGKEITRHVGYLPGGPNAMIKWIQSARKK